MTVPRAWHRLAKEAITALLKADGHAIKQLEGVLRANEQRLATLLSTAGLTGTTAIQAARRQSVAFAEELNRALIAARLGSKRASAERLRAEWSLVQTEIRGLGMQPPGELAISVETSKLDRVAARIAALSFADAWRTSVIAGISAARDTPGAFPAVALASSARVRYRLDRIASTENTRAFADVRILAMRGASRRYHAAPWFPFLGKQWDATLDAFLCNVCAALEGNIVGWSMSFLNDAVPGYVHPNCRCAVTTIFLPSGVEANARRDRRASVGRVEPSKRE